MVPILTHCCMCYYIPIFNSALGMDVIEVKTIFPQVEQLVPGAISFLSEVCGHTPRLKFQLPLVTVGLTVLEGRGGRGEGERTFHMELPERKRELSSGALLGQVRVCNRTPL